MVTPTAELNAPAISMIIVQGDLGGRNVAVQIRCTAAKNPMSVKNRLKYIARLLLTSTCSGDEGNECRDNPWPRRRQNEGHRVWVSERK